MPVASRKRSGPEQVAASDVKELDFVDETSFYRAHIQLGRPWRRYGGGKFVRNDDKTVEDRSGRRVSFDFKPSIHRTEPISGEVLNGLISAHNKWCVANRNHHPEGDMRKMVIVLDFEETKEVPTGRQNRDAVLAKLLSQGIVDGLVEAGLIKKTS